MQKKTLIGVIITILVAITIACVVTYCLLILNNRNLLHNEQIEDEPTQFYGIVIDAGSTGTRVLGFEFMRNGSELQLTRELWRQLKPGLSSLSPDETKQKITELLSYAEEFVPEEFWKDTTLKLKATAGFRLLDAGKSQEILDAVREVFKQSKFTTTKDSVEIIDGTDEGIYSWFSINYLRDLLQSNSKVAALDLGGGSTQVTFEISGDIPQNLKPFAHKVKNFDENTQLFVISYLGLGLMAFRHAVITKDSKDGELTVNSDCINPDISPFDWEYQHMKYKISGKSTENSTFDDCVTSIRRIVAKLLTPKIPSLQNQTINAFSYFFDRAIDAKLIKKNDEGEEIEVRKFRQRATEQCENPKHNDPWLCLDLTFMSVLLQDGYGLRDDKRVKLFTKINGHEANWALGSFLQDYMKRYNRKH